MNKFAYPPDGATYAVDDPGNRLSISYGVAGIYGRNLLNCWRNVTVGWSVSADIYNYITQVYRWFIVNGGQSFSCNLELDEITLTEAECKFILGSLKLNSIQGLTYNVSASFSVKTPDYDVVNKPWITDDGLNRIAMQAGRGIYLLTGRPVNFRLSHIHAPMATGVYHLTGMPADLSKKLLAPTLEAGVYLLTGGSVEFSKGRIALLDNGVYLLTGNNVDLTYTPLAGGTGWNPADKSSHITLSNSNKTMAGDGTLGGVRGAVGNSSGIKYFEIGIASDYDNGDANGFYAGLYDITADITAQPVFGAAGGFWGAIRFNSQYGDDSGFSSNFAGGGLSSGAHTLGFQANFTTRTLSMYLDGTLKFANAIWGSATTMYPFASSATLSTGAMTLRTKSSEFLQTPPIGSTAWE